MEKITKKDIEDALSKAIHPEINYSLVKLGMIKDTKAEDSNVSVTLALPFLAIPIKEDLINLIKESIKSLDKDMIVEVKTAEMSEKEKFMGLAQEGWNE